MKISVITVVRNDLKGLKKTVESVISQSDHNFEYIIIDGNSTDGCKEYLEALQCPMPLQKLSEPDTGIYNAMNKGIKMATGDYCIFMNAGDHFYDNQVIAHANKSLGDADFYIGHSIKAGKHEHKRYALKQMSLHHLLISSVYHQSTFTRTALLRQHLYREDLRIVSDWAFFLTQWLNGASYIPLDFFVSYEYTGGISTTQSQKMQEERNIVLNELFPNEIIRKSIVPQNKVWGKIYKAMTKSPVKRDFALIKYGFKFLLKDLF
ncbi:MAG: glycosyltransferase [Prevotella sp.]|jgi:glycosyltransferase involved in cell wall biosynthesis|nr:glycosyltransferase [Prevotella sp.]